MSIAQERNLTVDERDNMAEGLRQDAAALPDDLEKEICWSWRSAIAILPK